ncbi:MAG: M23 family metallopeptidase, partial [Ruminococcus bromii]
LYGHCSSLVAVTGQYVNQGDLIGYVGSTGSSTGPHLHFEIRLNGEKMDPLGYTS